ncbi:hypothetical protein [Bacillus smithii]
MTNEVVLYHFNRMGKVVVHLLNDKNIDLGYLFSNASTIEAKGDYIIFKK